MLSVLSARFTIAATRDSPGTTSLSSASRLPTRPSSPPIQVPVSEDAVTPDELLTSASSRQRNAFQCTILYRIPLAIGVGFHWYEPGIPVLSKLRRTLRSSQRMRWRSRRDRMLARVEATISLSTPAIVRSCARRIYEGCQRTATPRRLSALLIGP